MTAVVDSASSFINGIGDWVLKKTGIPKGLPYPGAIEGLHREARGCFTTNSAFDGGRAEIGKSFSPTFQIQHAFSAGASQTPSLYQLMAVVCGDSYFANGTVDHAGNVMARLDHTYGRLSNRLSAQMGAQFGQNAFVFEHSWKGASSSTELRFMNPNPLDLMGGFKLAYFRSMSRRLSLGLEGDFNSEDGTRVDSAWSLMGRYVFGDLSKGTGFTAAHVNPAILNKEMQEKAQLGQIEETSMNSILTATLQDKGMLQVSYYHPLTPKCDVGAEVQTLISNSPSAVSLPAYQAPGQMPKLNKRESQFIVGSKFSFQQTTIRLQADSSLKVTTVVEETLSPGIQLQISGELDHARGGAKFGVGLHFET